MTATKLKTTEDLLEGLHAARSDHARTLIAHAMDATRRYETARGNLAVQIEFLRRELDRAVGRMNEGDCPNSLGILQGNGVEVDRLCGELARTREAAAAAQRLLADLGISADGYIDMTDAESARHEAWANDQPGPGERMPDGSHGEGNCTV